MFVSGEIPRPVLCPEQLSAIMGCIQHPAVQMGSLCWWPSHTLWLCREAHQGTDLLSHKPGSAGQFILSLAGTPRCLQGRPQFNKSRLAEQMQSSTMNTHAQAYTLRHAHTHRASCQVSTQWRGRKMEVVYRPCAESGDPSSVDFFLRQMLQMP